MQLNRNPDPSYKEQVLLFSFYFYFNAVIVHRGEKMCKDLLCEVDHAMLSSTTHLLCIRKKITFGYYSKLTIDIGTWLFAYY